MPTLAHYQALLFDVDNTLTRTNKEIDPTTIQALNKLSDRGYLLGVCTAKSFPILHHTVLPYFWANSLHVLCGGAQISTTSGEVLWEKKIALTIFQDIQKELDALEAQYYVVEGNNIYAHPTLADYLKQHPFHPDFSLTTEADLESAALIGVYNVNSAIEQLLAQYYNQLTVKPMLNHRTGKPYVDITAVGVNKGVAIEKWSELTNVPLKEVIGFGDSDNDEEFLDLVGFAVAMGNATDELQELADRVIGHTDDNGLAEYLHEVISTGEL